jgi:5-methylcytosine-specific restriction endonuclease McrA
MDAATRRRVQARARHRCEYCRIHEDDEPFAFHLEHIIPKKHDGGDGVRNLAWSCHNCNLGKGANLSGLVRGEIVSLFHPRKQN